MSFLIPALLNTPTLRKLMDAAAIIITGLILEIIGAFFLSVEAIKLKNFRAIRDSFLKHIHHGVKSPKIAVQQDGEDEATLRMRAIELNKGIWGARHPKLFLALHYVAGLIVVFLLNIATDGLIHDQTQTFIQWAMHLAWYFQILVLFVAFWLVIVAGLWMLGELVHVSIMYLTSLPIEVVDFIDRRTASGTVGMIGFLLLALGGLIQIIGTASGN